jgi:putative ABC transport system substrate-binding protein
MITFDANVTTATTTFDTVGNAKPTVESGKITALAVSGKGRAAAMPDIPSFGELGIDGFDGLFVSLGALAPAGTPKQIVAALNRPGGNTTGFAVLEASLGGKWLELLSEIAPGLKRAAIMFNPDTSPASAYMPSLETAARSLKVVPFTAPVRSDVEIETAIIALGREPGGGLVVMPDVFMFAHRAPIILAAARNNVPAVYYQSFFARDGGLLSFGDDLVGTWRRAASYVDRILRGEKPGDLPVQLPTKFEMVLNLKTAKALGLTIPPSIWLRADEVIE